MGNGSKWWWTVVQGVIAALLGLYLLIGGNQAGDLVRLVAGAYILIASIIELVRGKGSVSRWRGIIGIIVGAAIVIIYFVDPQNTWDLTLFAIGVIIVGALGIYGSVFARSGRRFEWGPVIVNALLLLWGIAIFYFGTTNAQLQTVSGWILLIVGVVVAVWGYLTRGDDEEETPVVETPPAQEEIADKAEEVQQAVEDAAEEAAEDEG